MAMKYAVEVRISTQRSAVAAAAGGDGVFVIDSSDRSPPSWADLRH
jgi:hypothetical protein